MAAIHILPGFGGQYQSEDWDQNSTSGNDTFDLSHSTSFVVQINHVSGTPAGDVQVEQTFNGNDWANLGSAIAVTTDGTVSRFDETDGPFGRCRINPTGITAGSVNVTVTGFGSYL